PGIWPVQPEVREEHNHGANLPKQPASCNDWCCRGSVVQRLQSRTLQGMVLPNPAALGHAIGQSLITDAYPGRRFRASCNARLRKSSRPLTSPAGAPFAVVAIRLACEYARCGASQERSSRQVGALQSVNYAMLWS